MRGGPHRRDARIPSRRGRRLLVSSAGEEGPNAFQGYIEGNLVYMAPEEGGRIEAMAVEAGDDASRGPAPVRARIVDADRAEERGRGALRQAEAQLANLKAAVQRPGADRRAARARGAGAARKPSFAERVSSASRPCSSAASPPRRSSTSQGGLRARQGRPRGGAARRSTRRSSPAAPARSAPPRRRCARPKRWCARPRRGSPGAASPRRRNAKRAGRVSSGPARW